MNKIGSLIVALLILATGVVQGQCEEKDTQEIKKLLGNYYYDSSRISDIYTYNRAQTQEFKVRLFNASIYNFVFDASDMPKGVTIKLFELGKKGVRKEIYNSKNDNLTRYKTYTHRVVNPSKKMAIVYDVPAGTEMGCITYILGFVLNPEMVEQKKKKPRVIINN